MDGGGEKKKLKNDFGGRARAYTERKPWTRRAVQRSTVQAGTGPRIAIRIIKNAIGTFASA